jgi:hypothetical protein
MMHSDKALAILTGMFLVFFSAYTLYAADPLTIQPEMLDAQQTEAVRRVLERAFESQWKGMDAGVAAYTEGDVVALTAQGQSRKLLSGSGLSNGDTVKTGPNGNLLLIMPDAAMYRLGANSVMKVNAYSFAPDDPAGDQSDLSIQEGIVSYQTGKIADRSPASIKYRTPTLVAGILGSSGVIKVTIGGVTYYLVLSGKALLNTEQGIPIGEYEKGTLVRVDTDGSIKVLSGIPIDDWGRITEEGQKMISDTFGSDLADELTNSIGYSPTRPLPSFDEPFEPAFEYKKRRSPFE